MTEVYELEISTNATDMPFEKKFPGLLTLKELKKKLELVVGAESEKMEIKLHNSEGEFVSLLSDDSRTLKDLGVRDGMKLHAVDKTGRNEELRDDSMVEKYEMSDDKYDQRENSVRAWKKKLMEQSGAAQEKPANAAEEKNKEAAKNIKVGDRCEVRIQSQTARRGEVAFIGTTKFKEGIWVGVKYDEPVGKNDGSVAGVKYFDCYEKYGGFVRPTDVFVGDFPEAVRPIPYEAFSFRDMLIRLSLLCSAFFLREAVASPCSVSCMRDLLDVWERVRQNEPYAANFTLPVPFYGQSSLLALCDAYQKADESCRLSVCESKLANFANRHLGFVCGPFASIFFENIECISEVVKSDKTCTELIIGSPNPLDSEVDKCKEVDGFAECVEGNLQSECGVEVRSLVLKAIENYGCGQRFDMERVDSTMAKVNISGKYHRSASRSFIEERLKKPKLKFEEIENNDITSEGILETLEAEAEKESRGESSGIEESSGEMTVSESIQSGSMCDEDLQMKAMSCAVPLLRTWSAIKENRKEASEMFFPTFKYTRFEILELCDGYTNYVTCAPKSQLCIEEKMIRFTEEHLGFACAAENIAQFMRSHECISSLELSATATCNRFLVGDLVPGEAYAVSSIFEIGSLF
ncbi:unnamed protein product [Caenorhabditis auriculariae]|uniref:CAP-Gly domain-containing protein n=1 Tax=Caenorhabditis auriculariae TaxID=2777116 RepID=A0A8S1GVB8_9PELO|nr:unnamed protein product [Caenorhabditis auriculariae]